MAETVESINTQFGQRNSHENVLDLLTLQRNIVDDRMQFDLAVDINYILDQVSICMDHSMRHSRNT